MQIKKKKKKSHWKDECLILDLQTEHFALENALGRNVIKRCYYWNCFFDCFLYNFVCEKVKDLDQEGWSANFSGDPNHKSFAEHCFFKNFSKVVKL